ncbi:MAG: hypothetical protein M1837_004712 [Sclerophora amabilis]|nr:MAG: hypothetical protein M1837_004712 [Sclerophora amabilis]
MSIKPSVSKETIAKVVGVPTSQQNGLHNLTKNSKSFDLVEPSSTTDTSFSPVQLEPQPGGQNDSLTESSGLDASAEQHIRHLNGAVDALNIGDDTRPISASKPFDDSNPDTVLPKGDRAAFDSRTFSSNSETSSRRPPSIDGKSVTSGTNFALDEKESLRPDDSASVKAAEEEENLSAPSSRIGSETGVRAFRDQLQDIPERPRLQVHRSLAQGRVISPSNQRSNPQGSSPPQTGYDSTPVVAQPQVGVQSSGLPFGFTQQDPDEKLLEALDTPKDRLFILRLEQDVIDFVKDSK